MNEEAEKEMNKVYSVLRQYSSQDPEEYYHLASDWMNELHAALLTTTRLYEELKKENEDLPGLRNVIANLQQNRKKAEAEHLKVLQKANTLLAEKAELLDVIKDFVNDPDGTDSLANAKALIEKHGEEQPQGDTANLKKVIRIIAEVSGGVSVYIA